MINSRLGVLRALKAWSPVQALFRDGAVGKSLDNEDSIFINASIHFQTQSLNTALKDGGTAEVSHWEHDLAPSCLSLSPSQQDESSSFITSATMVSTSPPASSNRV